MNTLADVVQAVMVVGYFAGALTIHLLMKRAKTQQMMITILDTQVKELTLEMALALTQANVPAEMVCDIADNTSVVSKRIHSYMGEVALGKALMLAQAANTPEERDAALKMREEVKKIIDRMN